MSFDFDRAWRDAVMLFSDNRPLLLGIAGCFFFLPDVAVLIALPHLAELPAPDTDFAQAIKMITAVYTRYWWVFALLAASLIYGTLAMLALMKLRARPTVGEALVIALKSVPTYLAALLASMLAIDAVVVLVSGLAALTGLAALALIVLVAVVIGQFYLYARFAMTAPAIVIEGLRNPLGALQRSWRMTRGVGGRLLGFFALVGVAFMVSSLVATLLAGLVTALLGEGAARLGDAIVSAGIVAIAFTLFACLLAASYAQLARRGMER